MFFILFIITYFHIKQKTRVCSLIIFGFFQFPLKAGFTYCINFHLWLDSPLFQFPLKVGFACFLLYEGHYYYIFSNSNSLCVYFIISVLLLALFITNFLLLHQQIKFLLLRNLPYRLLRIKMHLQYPLALRFFRVVSS